MISFGFRKPSPDHIDLSSRRGYATRRFLLEHMQHVYGIFEAHRVNRSPSAAFVRRQNFHHAGPAKSPEGLSRWIDLSPLRSEQCLSDVAPDLGRKRT